MTYLPSKTQRMLFASSQEVGTTANQSLDLEASSSQDAVKTNPTGIDLTGDMTIEMLINVETYTSGSVLLAMNSSGEAESQNVLFYLALSGSDELVWLHESGAGVNNFATSSGVDVPTTTWVHIVAVRDTANKVIKFYKDGVWVDDTAYTNDATGGADTSLYLGSNLSANLFFGGKMKDVRIWDDIRTPAEIDFYKDKKLVGDEENLVGYFKLNGDYNDSTSNNNDLTANNAPSFSTDIPTMYDKLISYTIPANTVKKTGQTISISAFGQFAANANNKEIQVIFGESVLKDTAVGTPNATSWKIVSDVMQDSAGNQKTISVLNSDTVSFTEDASYVAITEDETADIEVAVYGFGVADNDVVNEGMYIQFLPTNT